MTAQTASLARKVFTDPVHFLAFGFGTGLAPVAPGTFGSLPGVLLALLTLELGIHIQIGIAIALFLAGIPICGISARKLAAHDHPGIVWDEICGMYVTLLLVGSSLLGIALGFALFRLFDILKPWPIRDLDHRLGGGLGIMLDDLVAALYALILLALVG
ncbi:MAG: phosphatidylglycerophosphatase A, partial [Woeseiaceae bacterium]